MLLSATLCFEFNNIIISDVIIKVNDIVAKIRKKKFYKLFTKALVLPIATLYAAIVNPIH